MNSGELEAKESKKVLNRFFKWQILRMKSKAKKLRRKNSINESMACEICERSVARKKIEHHFDICRKQIMNQEKIDEVVFQLQNILFQVFRLKKINLMKAQMKK